ncbi:MAG: hypothetical protein LBU14_01725 [Candidatus Peribacteria bacterium]|nr:hypothetical protein [Candidatus Peribacteria bacterium]
MFSITAPSKGIDEETIDKIVSIAKKLDVQLVTFSPPYFKDSNVSWFSQYLQKIRKEVSFSIAIKNIEPEFMFLVIPKYRKASFVDIKKITGDSVLDVSSVDNSS